MEEILTFVRLILGIVCFPCQFVVVVVIAINLGFNFSILCKTSYLYPSIITLIVFLSEKLGNTH